MNVILGEYDSATATCGGTADDSWCGKDSPVYTDTARSGESGGMGKARARHLTEKTVCLY